MSFVPRAFFILQSFSTRFASTYDLFKITNLKVNCHLSDTIAFDSSDYLVESKKACVVHAIIKLDIKRLSIPRFVGNFLPFLQLVASEET